jgi:hypothetical protein
VLVALRGWDTVLVRKCNMVSTGLQMLPPLHSWRRVSSWRHVGQTESVVTRLAAAKFLQAMVGVRRHGYAWWLPVGCRGNMEWACARMLTTDGVGGGVVLGVAVMRPGTCAVMRLALTIRRGELLLLLVVRLPPELSGGQTSGFSPR